MLRSFSCLRFVLAAACAAGVLVLVGCGGNDEEALPTDEPTPTGEAAEAVAEAAERTIEAGSARIAYDALFQTGTDSVAFEAEGEVDYGAYRTRFLYDMSNVPVAGAEEVEVLLDGTVAYVRFPQGAPELELPEGREWIRVEAPQPPGAGDEPLVAPRLDLSAMQQDPTQFLHYLRTGATEVIDEGTDTVRGVETTIYTTLIDLDLVLENGREHLGPDEEQREVAVRWAEELRDQVGGAPVGATVNVDADGLIRRVLISFDVRTGEQGELLSTLTTTDYFDFGADVELEPPPDDGVVDAADVE
jgi:hypothetical protein